MNETHLLDLAWGIIANAGDGDWDKESKEWVEAAEKWRDLYLANRPACICDDDVQNPSCEAHGVQWTGIPAFQGLGKQFTDAELWQMTSGVQEEQFKQTLANMCKVATDERDQLREQLAAECKKREQTEAELIMIGTGVGRLLRLRDENRTLRKQLDAAVEALKRISDNDTDCGYFAQIADAALAEWKDK
jgi:hypothetical protein